MQVVEQENDFEVPCFVSHKRTAKITARHLVAGEGWRERSQGESSSLVFENFTKEHTQGTLYSSAPQGSRRISQWGVGGGGEWREGGSGTCSKPFHHSNSGR